MKRAKLESMEATGWMPPCSSLVYSSSETYRGPARILDPLTQSVPSRAIQSMGWYCTGDHHPPLTALQPTYGASLSVTAFTWNNLSSAKTKDTLP